MKQTTLCVVLALSVAALLFAASAHAQQPPDPFQAAAKEWESSNVASGHVAEKILELGRQYEGAKSQYGDAESRLKWVLDNWVPKAATEQPAKGAK